MSAPKLGAVYLRWEKKEGLLKILTEDRRVHRLTIEDGVGLIFNLFRTLPKNEVRALLDGQEDRRR